MFSIRKRNRFCHIHCIAVNKNIVLYSCGLNVKLNISLTLNFSLKCGKTYACFIVTFHSYFHRAPHTILWCSQSIGSLWCNNNHIFWYHSHNFGSYLYKTTQKICFTSYLNITMTNFHINGINLFINSLYHQWIYTVKLMNIYFFSVWKNYEIVVIRISVTANTDKLCIIIYRPFGDCRIFPCSISFFNRKKLLFSWCKIYFRNLSMLQVLYQHFSAKSVLYTGTAVIVQCIYAVVFYALHCKLRGLRIYIRHHYSIRSSISCVFRFRRCFLLLLV